MKVVIEGPQGTGKTTVAALLRDLLRSLGFVVDEGDEFPFPTAEEGARSIRKIRDEQVIEISTRQS